jgi:hypothetical protein
MATRSSSKHRKFKHPYCVDQQNRDLEDGKQPQWTTSKIIRETKDQSSPIVDILILTK